jgi:hypothetical protein
MRFNFIEADFLPDWVKVRAHLAPCGTLAKTDFELGVKLRGVGDLARPALRAH